MFRARSVIERPREWCVRGHAWAGVGVSGAGAPCGRRGGSWWVVGLRGATEDSIGTMEGGGGTRARADRAVEGWLAEVGWVISRTVREFRAGSIAGMGCY